MTEPSAVSRERLLIVEDNDIVGTALERVLSAAFAVTRVPGVSAALERIEAGTFDVVLADYLLDEEGRDGFSVLRHARERQPAALRFLMSGGDVPGLDASLAEGTLDGSLAKPFSRAAFTDLLARARAARSR